MYRLPIIIACCTSVALTGLRSESANGQSSEDDNDVDAQLLDDLGGDDLLEGLDDIPIDPSFGEDNTKDKSKDGELRQDLIDGEDIGQPSEDPLTTIARQMKDAQRRIEEQEVSSSTQDLQKEIVTKLDAIIKELEQKKKQCQSSSSSSSSGGNPQVKQPDQQPNQGQQQPSNKPATDSAERLGQQNAAASDEAALEALVKQVWGHLPDRARQQMQNATVEDFLPKYQQIIEDYYRRLAEEPPR